MLSTSPRVTIPDVTDHRLRAAPRRPARRQAGADRRAHRPHPHLSPARRRRAAHGGRPGQARASARATCFAIYCPNLPEYAIVFLGVAMAGGDQHHRQPALHRRRAGQPAPRLGRALPGHGAALPRQGEGGARPRAGVEEIFVFGAAEGARPFTDLLQAGDSPPAVTIDPGRGPGRAAVLERHHRPAQGRDAHAPQPGREPLPGRGHAELRVLRRARHHDGGAAVLPHLRHGRDHDARPGRRRHHPGHAALRHDGVPRPWSRSTG